MRQIALAGGVALNSPLRTALKHAADDHGYQIFTPRDDLCMDNGAMVAGAASFLFKERGPDPISIDTRANAPLGSMGIRYRHDSKYK